MRGAGRQDRPRNVVHRYGRGVDPSTCRRDSTSFARTARAISADCAGDLLLTVDGADVASLTPQGVVVLIAERPPGTTAHLGLSRSGQPATADLVIPPQ